MAEGVVNQMNGVYWTGQDGNTYINVEGIAGGAQEWKAPLLSPTQMGLTQIADPNAPQNTGGATQSGPTQGEIDASRDNTVNAGRTLLSGKSSEYDTKQRDFVNSVSDQQNTINTGRASNALNFRRSMSSIAGGVRQGIRSGGVMLANMGASDSGAAQAMANAYGQEGNNLAGDANNEFELQDQTLVGQQNILNRNKTDGMNDLNTWKTQETNKIKGSLAADLGTLAATASANGRGGVDLAVVDQLVNDALTQMAAVDQRSAGQMAGITSYDRSTANDRAIEMDNAGMAASNPFSVGGVDMFQPAGAGGQMQGAPITQIPLKYTRRNY